MTSYKLYYFDIKGMGEPIRLTLAQAGVPFEDVRILPEQWPDIKPSQKASKNRQPRSNHLCISEMPFGQLPVLEMPDGFMLTQSAAILRYLGAAHGKENVWGLFDCTPRSV